MNEKKAKQLRRLTRQEGQDTPSYIAVNKRVKLLLSPNEGRDALNLENGILPATYESSTRLLANGNRARYQKMKRQLRA